MFCYISFFRTWPLNFLTSLFLQQLGSGAIPRDAEYYRSENRRLTEQNNALQEQNDQLTDELRQTVEERAKLEQDAEVARKVNKDLKMEVSDCYIVNCEKYEVWLNVTGMELKGSKSIS